MTHSSLAFSTASAPPKAARRARLDRLAGLRVFVVGLETHVSRDTVRYLIARKANATALGAGWDIDLLQRDLELAHTSANLAPIETMNPSELRLVAENLRELGALPHLIACCCSHATCPLPLMAPLMQPSLILHAVSPRPGWLAAGFARTLSSLLGLDDLLNPAVRLPRVRLGRHLFDVRRRERRPHARAGESGDQLVSFAAHAARPSRR